MKGSQKGWANPEARYNRVKILKELKAGKKYKEIGEQFNVSIQRISRIAIQEGFRRKNARSDKIKPDEQPSKLSKLGLQSHATRNAIILALSKPQKYSTRQIAKLLGMTECAVNHIKHKYKGIDIEQR